MHLLRLSGEMNLNPWDKSPCDASAIIKAWFGKDENVSVYEVNTVEEEAEVAAAHTLCELSRGLKKGVYALRIELGDLAAVNAQASLCSRLPGITGVVSVDFKHRELMNATEYLTALVSHIRERYVVGEPRFRWFGVPVLTRHLERFLDRPHAEVIQEAQRRSKGKVSAAAGGNLPGPKGSQIREQLRADPPVIPHQAIEVRAYARFLETGCWDSNENWHAAEAEIREIYENGIASYKSP